MYLTVRRCASAHSEGALGCSVAMTNDQCVGDPVRLEGSDPGKVGPHLAGGASIQVQGKPGMKGTFHELRESSRCERTLGNDQHEFVRVIEHADGRASCHL